MNILYHHRTQASGAAGHHIREMVSAFEKLGYHVDINSPIGINDSRRQKTGSQKKNRYAIPQILFELFEISYNFIDLIRLLWQLRKKKYSFIYERYSIFNIAGIMASRIRRIPIIIEVSFTSKTSVFPKRTGILSPLANLIDRFVFNRADGIVAVSTVLKDGLIRDFGIDSDKIIVLPNAADPAVFRQILPVIQPRGSTVGFVGGFYPWHGLDILIDAAGHVIKEIPDARFLLIGDGPMRDGINDKVREKGLEESFMFTGSIPHEELPRYVESFDIGVMPDSNDYGSPIKIFEYMAMGKPIVAPNVGPIEEVVKDGENGLLFERRDAAALGAAIIRLLSDEKLYNTISSNSRKAILDKHNWLKNAETVLAKWGNIFKADTKEEIRFVLQYFHPEVASTAQLMTELAQALVSRGLKVKALAGQPTYVKREKLPNKEVYKGIEIERLPCTRFDKNSSMGRMLNWLSFTYLVFFKLLFSRDRSTLFIVSTPPFLFVVGYLLNIIRGQKYVCLVYDLYPDIAERLGYIKKDSSIAKIWNGLNKRFFRRASFVVVPSENMKALIEDKIGDYNGKVKVIYNWADGDFIRPIDKNNNWFARKYDLIDKLTVLYAGNMGLFHQLETLVEAADKLRMNKNIKFIFIGEGGKKKKLMDMASEKNLDNIVFLPYQDKEVLPYSLTCSDISVVSLEKSLDCVAAPCKLYTSLAAGQIILGLVDINSDVAKVVNRSESGFCARQDDVSQVVGILKMLSNNPELIEKIKINSRRCFEDNFQKDKAIEGYSEIFSMVG